MDEKMIVIAIPEALHRAVKMRAAARRMTLKGYVIEALRKSVREEKP